MEVLAHILAALQFSTHEIEEYRKSSILIILTRFKQALHAALTDKEKSILTKSVSLEEFDFTDIKSVPDMALRKKLVAILTRIVLGVLSEFVEAVGRDLTHDQRARLEQYVASTLTQSHRV